MVKLIKSAPFLGCIFMICNAIAIPVDDQYERNSVTNDKEEIHAESSLIDFNHANKLVRYKRSSSVNRKLKGRHKNPKRKGERKNNKHTDNMVKAIHFVIPEQYSTENIKTGPRGDVIPYWEKCKFKTQSKQRFLRLNNNGTVTVLKNGLYMIYSQLTYFDRTGRWSHAININDEPFIKCVTSEWGVEVDPDTGLYYNTIQQCYTSAVSYLTKNDKISIVSFYPDRVIHTESEMSFWGIVKFT